jgi:hypothetical protein
LKRREVELQELREKEAQEEIRRREREMEEKRRVEEKLRLEQQSQRENAAKTAASEPRTSALSNSTTNNHNTRGNPPSRSARKPPSQPAPTTATLLTRLTSLAHHLRQTIGPSRLLIFLFAFLLLASRRDLRVRLRQGWDKVRRTVGMGVKVSYV